MFACDFSEKIFQTLPGQGWRVLIEWKPEAVDIAEGFPAVTCEPIVAWVSARIPRKGLHGEYDEVVIAPLVRYPDGRELVLLDDRANFPRKAVYLAPGEELSQRHFDQLRGGYAAAVSPVGTDKGGQC